MGTYLENGLLIFGEGVLADQLHDFSQFVFLLEDLLDGFFEGHEFRVVLVVVLAKHSVVI